MLLVVRSSFLVLSLALTACGTAQNTLCPDGSRCVDVVGDRVAPRSDGSSDVLLVDQPDVLLTADAIEESIDVDAANDTAMVELDVVSTSDAVNPPPPMDVVVMPPPMDVVTPPPPDVVRVDTVVPPPDAPPPPPPRFTTFFSTRAADNAADSTIENAVIDLIQRALPGSRIRVAVYTFTRDAVTRALVDAQRRGVDVRIVLDGGAGDTPGSEVTALRTGLGTDRVTLCGAPGTSCIGTGIMHHKTFLFSALNDGSMNVVMQASHNLTNAQRSMHNNAVVIRGDVALFNAYERTWNDLRRDVENPNYYRIDDGDMSTRVYFYPRSAGDTVTSVLDNINCDRTSTVRVAMAFFTDARMPIASALARTARAGCSVELVVGNDEIPIGTQVLSTLRGAGITVTLYPARTNGWGLHSKYFVIDAPYDGSTGHRRLVFTGSHNWTGPALTSNDETMLRLENAGVFDAFAADWMRVRAAAARP